MKIIVGDGPANVDQVLVENVALANQWYRQLKGGLS
jgi:hypothetical protein